MDILEGESGIWEPYYTDFRKNRFAYFGKLIHHGGYTTMKGRHGKFKEMTGRHGSHHGVYTNFGGRHGQFKEFGGRHGRAQGVYAQFNAQHGEFNERYAYADATPEVIRAQNLVDNVSRLLDQLNAQLSDLEGKRTAAQAKYDASKKAYAFWVSKQKICMNLNDKKCMRETGHVRDTIWANEKSFREVQVPQNLKDLNAIKKEISTVQSKISAKEKDMNNALTLLEKAKQLDPEYRAQIAEISLQAAEAQSQRWMKWALIGGGLVVTVVVARALLK